MIYAKIRDNTIIKYPYTLTNIRNDYRNVSFPKQPSEQLLNEYGVYSVTPVTKPQIDSHTHKVVEGTPVKIGAQWTQNWDIVPLTQDEVNEALNDIQQNIINDVQSRLDNFARTRGYDGIMSACTYVTSANPKFQAEGQYCVQVRDATWNALYNILEEVQNGTRPVPNGYSDIKNSLPTLTWPN